MSENNNQKLFRKKALDRISSPDQLTDYLHVTSPGIWLVLLAVIIILCGFAVWATVGTLKTYAPASVKVNNGMAEVVTRKDEMLEAGMALEVGSKTYQIDYTYTDETGRMIGYSVVDLPEGSYDGSVLIEEIRPVDFLFESR